MQSSFFSSRVATRRLNTDPVHEKVGPPSPPSPPLDFYFSFFFFHRIRHLLALPFQGERLGAPRRARMRIATATTEQQSRGRLQKTKRSTN